MNERQLSIIGCGLIGGSIGLSLRRRHPRWQVIGVDLSERLSAVQETGIFNQAVDADSLPTCLPGCDMVILATPVDEIIDTLEKIAPLLSEGTVVMDVGSTKTRILDAARALLPSGIHFVGGHPMAGSSRAGIEAADPLLFDGRVFLLCPCPDTPTEALLSAIDLVEDLQAIPVTIEPEEHDKMMATVSHVPHLVAVALMNAALQQDVAHGLLDLVAGRTFLDMTRIAGSDYRVWQSILATNREAILGSLDRFENCLALLRKSFEAGDIAAFWEAACRRRRRMSLETLPRLRKPDYRGLIDHYDRQLLSALGSRMKVVRMLGRLKRQQETPVVDLEREQQLRKKREKWGESLNLPRELVEDLFSVILAHSSRSQAADS